MKKLVLIAFLWFLYSFSFSQNILNENGNILETPKIVSSKNLWTEVSYGFRGETQSQRYTFSEDSTLIDSTWYFNVLYSNDKDGENWIKTRQYLRNADDKVYLMKDNKESILYDFSLMKGDTFTIVDHLGERELYVVDVDTIELLDNTKRKRIDLRCEYFPEESTIWIEGIGDLKKGLLSAELSCLFDIHTYLLCFYENGEQIYFNQDLETCWILSTSVDDLLTSNLTIYPNPVSHTLSIDEIEGELAYTIYSAMGSKMLSGLSKGDIDVSTLLPGFYVLTLSNDKEILKTNFIKMD